MLYILLGINTKKTSAQNEQMPQLTKNSKKHHEQS